MADENRAVPQTSAPLASGTIATGTLRWTATDPRIGSPGSPWRATRAGTGRPVVTKLVAAGDGEFVSPIVFESRESSPVETGSAAPNAPRESEPAAGTEPLLLPPADDAEPAVTVEPATQSIAPKAATPKSKATLKSATDGSSEGGGGKDEKPAEEESPAGSEPTGTDDPKTVTSPPPDREAISLEGDDKDLIDRMFRWSEASLDWTLRGDDTDGIGFFTLNNNTPRDIEPELPNKFDIDFSTNFHFVSGPGRSDLPPRLFDLFFNVHWLHHFTEHVGVDANFDLGVYTDFEDTTKGGWRFPGHAVGFVKLSDSVTVLGGIEYLDRDTQQMLPAGGVLLKPSEDVRLNLYFPRPKLSVRTSNKPEYDRWVYLAGDYKGSSWAIERTNGNPDVATLNEYRLTLGTEVISKDEDGDASFLEVAWLFNRELAYRSGIGNFDPHDTVMFRWGTRY